MTRVPGQAAGTRGRGTRVRGKPESEWVGGGGRLHVRGTRELGQTPAGAFGGLPSAQPPSALHLPLGRGRGTGGAGRRCQALSRAPDSYLLSGSMQGPWALSCPPSAQASRRPALPASERRLFLLHFPDPRHTRLPRPIPGPAPPEPRHSAAPAPSARRRPVCPGRLPLRRADGGGGQARHGRGALGSAATPCLGGHATECPMILLRRWWLSAYRWYHALPLVIILG